MSFFGKKISWYWIIPTVIVTAAVSVMSTFIPLSIHYRAKVSEAYRASDVDAQTYQYVKDLFETYYIGELGEFDENIATDSLIASYVASTGDKYARYLSPEMYQIEMAELEGNFVGIGVMVTYDPETPSIEVLLPLPDSPAEAAGIKEGDLIVAVDELTVEKDGYIAVADAMKGESGSEVTVRILRDGAEKEITLARAAVQSISVFEQMASDGKTGIIRITEFNEATVAQFSSAVEKLQMQGAERFVFDMRDNPGGELESVLSVLDYILPKGNTLIRIVDAEGNEATREATDDHTLDCPMAVLINENTASAAELFTSCLRDYDKAELVGVKSYGKGCMQCLFPLPNGGCVSITYRMYNPPIGDNYDGLGIEPDHTVELNEEAASINLYKLTEENDDQLKAALELLAAN